MIKVIIMIPSALTERWQGMFCIDALASQFDLEYWDCSKICKPAFEASATLERDYVHIITNFGEMENNLQRLPNDAVIFSHIHLEGYNYELHELISRYNRNRVYVDFWANRITTFIDESLCQDTVIKNKNKVFRKKVEHTLEKIPPLYYFFKYIENGGGSKYVAFRDEKRKLDRYYKAVPLYNRFLISVKPRMKYSINHPDYEKYLSIVQSEDVPLVKGRYIVYLDQCFPMHPSLKTENPDVDFEALAKPYYESMNRFFSMVEKQYDCEVVIAGHPIANYENNPFEGRKIFYFKTAELVATSFAVLLHCSFSVSFPILFDKPFCILSNSAIRNATEVRNNIERFSSAFQTKIIDTDNTPSADNVFQPLEKEIKDKYVNLFFDTTIKEKNSDLLAHHIMSIHDVIIAQNT